MEKNERLKIIRILNGYTQEGLAKLIDLPRSALSIWEGGKYGPAEDSVPKLASILQVDPGYLLFGYPDISPAVWIPQAPVRPQHLKSLISDVYSLFPLFLTENHFNVVIPCELADGGGVFLIGRDAGKERPKIITSCLLLADKRLVDSFKVAFRAADMRINNNDLQLKNTIDAVSIDEISTIIRWLNIKCDFDKLSDKLAEVRNRKIKGDADSSSAISFRSLHLIFRSILYETRNYKLSDEVLTKLADMFISMSRSLGHKAADSIDSTDVMAETRNTLVSLGCEQKIEISPIKTLRESEDPQYCYFKEWLRETWLEANPEQKAALIEEIRKNTNYDLWLEKYQQETREGKRGAIWDF